MYLTESRLRKIISEAIEEEISQAKKQELILKGQKLIPMLKNEDPEIVESTRFVIDTLVGIDYQEFADSAAKYIDMLDQSDDEYGGELSYSGNQRIQMIEEIANVAYLDAVRTAFYLDEFEEQEPEF